MRKIKTVFLLAVIVLGFAMPFLGLLPWMPIVTISGAPTDGPAELDATATWTNPEELSKIDDGGQARDVYVVGNLAYVADNFQGLEIINVTDPTNPVEIGEYDTGGTAMGVFVLGNLAYVADNTQGLKIFNVSDPTNPVKIGTFDDGGAAWDVFVEGGLAYVADGNDGLEIFNVTDPTNPVEVGEVYDGALGTAYDVEVSGNLAYVADGNNGLEIINVTDPTNPVEIGEYDPPGQFSGLHVEGNLVYMAGNGLAIINVTNPQTPTLEDQFSILSAQDVHVVGNRAFVANYFDGLEIFNVTDPTNLQKIG